MPENLPNALTAWVVETARAVVEDLAPLFQGGQNQGEPPSARAGETIVQYTQRTGVPNFLPSEAFKWDPWAVPSPAPEGSGLGAWIPSDASWTLPG